MLIVPIWGAVGVNSHNIGLIAANAMLIAVISILCVQSVASKMEPLFVQIAPEDMLLWTIIHV